MSDLKSTVSTKVVTASTKRDSQSPFVEELADRVRRLATAKRFNPTSLGTELGIASSTAANYWAGKRPWPTEVLPDLADALATPVEFLLRGNHPSIDSEDIVEIAQIDLRYGLGGAFVNEEEIESEPRQFSRQWLRTITDSPPSLLFWARGRGNSMSPTIEDGEIVLGDRSQTLPRDDDLIWACVMGDIGMIKRLRIRPDRITILSDNPTVPADTAHADDGLRIVGRIIAVVKNI